MRKKGIPILIVLAVLIIGGILAAQSGDDSSLLPSDPLPLGPEASVFEIAPNQRGPLAGIIIGTVVVVVGMGIGLAVTVNQLEKAYRHALEEDDAIEAAQEAISAQEEPAEVHDIHMPPASLAPIGVATGATFFLLGILITPLFFIGGVVLLFAIIGWVLTQEHAIHE